MSKTTITGRSQQVAVRVPFDVLEWLRVEAGDYRGVSAVIKEKLRESYNKSGFVPSPVVKARKAKNARSKAV